MTFWSLCRCDCSRLQIRRSLDFEMFSILRGRSAMNTSLMTANYSSASQSKYVRVNVVPTESAEKAFSLDDFKPKKHPGRFNLARVELPEKFVEGFRQIACNEDLKSVNRRADLLYQYLKSRKLPVEEDEYKHRVMRIEDELKVSESYMDAFLSEEEKKKKEKSMDDKIRHRLKKSLYHWEPIDYTRSKSLEYILARTAGEYAVLCRVFSEIATRDPDFQPQTLFDFGSGVGTVVWAANRYWQKSLVEHMCVDISRDMNDIAELILKKGSSKSDTIFPGVFFRQFFPAAIHRKYNLVVSSYTLTDLPTAKVRLETIDKLWRNTNKYLVLVEQGTNSGFVALNEARDYILQLHKKDEPERGDGEDEVKHSHGFTFSPCPHDTWCPRYMKDHKPCNFYIGYKRLYPFFTDSTESEVFSYVVLKKGERSGKAEQWPRLVKEPLRRGGHIICRLCTSDGQLAESVLTKAKNPKKLYRCARMSSCGDLLPVQIIEKEVNEGTAYESESEEYNEDFPDNEADVSSGNKTSVQH